MNIQDYKPTAEQLNNPLFPVYEFRPDKLSDSKNLLRFDGGNWIDDDGEYDLAFVSKDSPFAFYIRIPYQINLAWSWCKNGNWMGYVHNHPNENPWHYMSKDGSNETDGRWDRDKHLNEIAGRLAMSKCSEKFRCANGRSAEFNVSDATIQAGLLRKAGTKEIVVPPKIFKCIYCGNHDWRKEESK